MKCRNVNALTTTMTFETSLQVGVGQRVRAEGDLMDELVRRVESGAGEWRQDVVEVHVGRHGFSVAVAVGYFISLAGL